MSSKASCRTQERVLKSLISTPNTATKSQKNADVIMETQETQDTLFFLVQTTVCLYLE